MLAPMTDLQVGDVLAAELSPFTQDQVNAFGELMGTNGKIHTDPEYARGTPRGRTLVQGMLVLAPVEQVMSRLAGPSRWLAQGRIEAKIVGMTSPGDAAALELTVQEVSPALRLSFAIRAAEAVVLVGEASA